VHVVGVRDKHLGPRRDFARVVVEAEPAVQFSVIGPTRAAPRASDAGEAAVMGTTRGIEVFWTWFVANAARVRDGGPGAADVSAEITTQIHRIDPGLVWEITPAKAGDWVFAVSADGNRKLF